MDYTPFRISNIEIDLCTFDFQKILIFMVVGFLIVIPIGCNYFNDFVMSVVTPFSESNVILRVNVEVLDGFSLCVQGMRV